MVYILGVAGACRREELAFLKVSQIEDLGTALLIKIPDNKTNRPRSFTVTGEYLRYYRKYSLLRPPNFEGNDRFFLGYRNGKCCKQNVGIHKIGAIPFEIASHLKLANAKEYTGHCFRRTSATLLADAGADITLLKRHGGWKSSTVAEGYVDESINNKLEIANKILNHLPHTSTVRNTITSQHSQENSILDTDLTTTITQTEYNTLNTHKTQTIIVPQSTLTENVALDLESLNRPIIIQNCSNFTINIKGSETM